MFQSLFSRNPAEQGPVDNERLYKCLEVDRDCDVAQIKKAYHRLARIHHPDKGGDPDQFKEIYRAYEILSDSRQRSIYDQLGESGLDGSGGGSFESSFTNMFQQPPLPRKPRPTVFHLRVTLDELYTGITKILQLKSKITCTQCEGVGGSEHHSCPACTGRGMRLAVRPIGPGMMQQVYVSCTDCSGSGVSIPPHATCTMCKGEKKTDTVTPLSVVIEKGMRGGTKITLPAREHEVVVIIQEIDHPRFTRHGPHLFMRCSITLRQALTGLRKKIPHLNNRHILVQSPPNRILGSGTYQRIAGEGMDLSGDLFLEMEIVFPLELPLLLQASLKEHLEEEKEEDDFILIHPEVDYECSSVGPDEVQNVFALNTHKSEEVEEESQNQSPDCRTQ
jgi:DnaJ family protein A protein 2